MPQPTLYSVDLNRPKTPLELEIDKLLDGKGLFALTSEQQITYCQLKKQLIQEVWSDIAYAVEQGDYVRAVKAYAFQLEFGTDKDLPEIVLPIKQAEEPFVSNDPISQLYRGLYVIWGVGTPRDDREANLYLRASAEAGNALAQCHLASGYEFNQGVNFDLINAIHLYRLSASQHFALAQFILGDIYQEEGYQEWIVINPSDSLKWYKKSADQGNIQALRALGDCYRDGRGTAKDPSLALAYHWLAAELGCPLSQVSLGDYYYQGIVVDQDTESAVYWYTLAAEQGNQDALYQLRKINTPQAKYSVAALTENYSTMLELALSTLEFQPGFIAIELNRIFYSANSAAKLEFLESLRLSIESDFQAHRHFLIRLLLAVDRTLLHDDENLSGVMIDLVNHIKLDDIPGDCIKSFLFFLCDIYFADPEQQVLPTLTDLWFKGHMDKAIVMDPELNKLVGAVLVHHYLKQEYCLSINVEISDPALMAMIYYFTSQESPTAQGFMQATRMTLLIQSKEHPVYLLPALYVCLEGIVKAREGQPQYFVDILFKLRAHMQPEQPLDSTKAEQLFMFLVEDAQTGLAARNKFSFFKLDPIELELAQRIGTENLASVLVWIEENTMLVVNSESSSRRLG